jgi:hypothetical protein
MILTLTVAQNIDKEREFIIQCFLEDDSIQIQEVPVRNSGFVGGKFLARGKQFKADGSPLRPHDIAIGEIVRVRCHEFEVLDADERTIIHMEKYNKLWPQSNINLVKQLLKNNAIGIQRQINSIGDVALGYAAARKFIADAGVNLSLQQSITLFRVLDPKNSGFIRTTEVIV